LLIQLGLPTHETQGGPKLVLREYLHPHQESYAVALAPGPTFDDVVDLSPPSEIEVADAEVGPLGDLEGVFESWQEELIDIVEDAWHHVPLR
jgi:hypothetical protein